MCHYSCTRKHKICLTDLVSSCSFQSPPLGEDSYKYARRRQKFFKYVLSYIVHRVTEDLAQNLQISFTDPRRPFEDADVAIRIFGHFKIEFLTQTSFCRLVKRNTED